jgi:hypothetical protein
MVLLQVDPRGDPITPFECQTPRAIDVNGIALRPAAQTMKIETRLTKRIKRGRRFDGIEPGPTRVFAGRAGPEPICPSRTVPSNRGA